MKAISKNILAAASILLVLASCQETTETPTATVDVSNQATQNARVIESLEDIDELVLTGFQQQGLGERSLVSANGDLCEKVAITHNSSEKTLIVDFGEGCVSPHGITRKGKIIATYSGRYWMPGTEVVITFEDFYRNDLKIEGTRYVKNEGFDAEQLTFTFGIRVEGGKITHPDGTSRTIESNHTRIIYLPNQERELYVTLTGVSEGITRGGETYRTEIVDPLVFLRECVKAGIFMPTKGQVLLQVDNMPDTEIDFGDNECDRKYNILRNGETIGVPYPKA